MRILLDECIPRPLRHELPGHDVRTVPEMGWSGKRNGDLLQLMTAENFDVFLTVDQNLRYQQNLKAVRVGIVMFVASSNRLVDLVPLMPKVHGALAAIQPGDYVEVAA